MSSKKLLALIKFGHKDHMIDLLQNGTIYMKPPSYFRGLPPDNIRSDHNEFAEESKPIDWMKFQSNDGKEEYEFDRNGKKGPKILNGHWSIVDPTIRMNIYSMYAITADWSDKHSYIDPRIARFGDGDPAMVVIQDIGELKKRLMEKLDELVFSAKGKPIDYYEPNTYKGPVGPFRKSADYSYECEFRLVVNYKEGASYEKDGALRIQIGSLRDIANIYPANNVSDIKVEISDPQPLP